MENGRKVIWEALLEAQSLPKEVCDLRLIRISGMIDYAYLVKHIYHDDEVFLRKQIENVRNFKQLETI